MTNIYDSIGDDYREGWKAAKADSQIEIEELKKEVNSLRAVIKFKCCDIEDFEALQKENELLNQELNYAFQQCSTCQMPELTARTNKSQKYGPNAHTLLSTDELTLSAPIKLPKKGGSKQATKNLKKIRRANDVR